MLYRIGADAVLLAHSFFVAFAVCGGAFVYYSHEWLWVHLPVVLWSSMVNLASSTCPLTPLDKALRVRAGQSGYAGGFVKHYVGRLVHPRGMPRQLEFVAGVLIVVWNIVVYAAAFGVTR
jgi:hypothetical protein